VAVAVAFAIGIALSGALGSSCEADWRDVWSCLSNSGGVASKLLGQMRWLANTGRSRLRYHDRETLEYPE
jgi:hypothetical protein